MAEKHIDNVSTTHYEDASDTARGGEPYTRDNPLSCVEEVHYGSSGARGILKSPYVFGATLLASMGGFSYGYDQGVVSLILVMPQFQKQFPQTNPSAPGYGFHTGFLTAMLVLGGFVGCVFFPKLADKISRKRALTVAVIFFDVGAIIQTVAKDYTTLTVGRAIGGIGVGTLAMGAPLYISEVSPPELRGSLMVLEELSIVIGAIVSYWVTYGTREIAGSEAFTIPFGLQMIPATILGVGILLFPYSPRWLAMVDRNEDSLKSLARLRHLSPTDSRVQAEWRGILGEVAFQKDVTERNHPGITGFKLEIRSWFDLFNKSIIKRTVVACGICFFTQFSGINAFVYYTPTLFQTLGQGYNESLILSGMMNIAQLFGVIPTLLFMDRIGRRPLAIWGAIGMGIPHAIMAALTAKYSSDWSSHPSAGWVCVAVVYIYIFFFGFSYGPLIWTLPAELFPNAYRARGVGLAVAVSWLANVIIGIAVPPMLQMIGYGTFVFFAVFCFLAAIFSYLLVPETANKTLEQLEMDF